MKAFLSFILFLLIIASAHATVHTITCQNTPSHFLPVTVNAVVGDTIHWTWIEGGHIVGPVNSSYIPSGAVTWSAPIDASNHSFEYVVTVAGNYHYVCHPATPHGEDSYIVVTNLSGVQQYNGVSNPSAVCPNPSAGKFTLNSGIAKGEFVIYNIGGKRIYQSVIINPVSDIDLRDHAHGVYLIAITYDDGSRVVRKIVKE